MEKYDLNIDKAPNTKRFLDDLTKLIEDLGKPEYKKLREENKFNELEDLLIKKYTKIFEENYSLIFSIIRYEISDFNILVKMLNVMILLETKQIDKNKANEIIKDTVNELYIYPKFGGKDNFEKIIKARHKN